MNPNNHTFGSQYSNEVLGYGYGYGFGLSPAKIRASPLNDSSKPTHRQHKYIYNEKQDVEPTRRLHTEQDIDLLNKDRSKSRNRIFNKSPLRKR